jgi:hypothetical protein
MDGSELLYQLKQVLTVAGADDGVGNVADALYDIHEKLQSLDGKLGGEGDNVVDGLTDVAIKIEKLGESIEKAARAVASAVNGVREELILMRRQSTTRE